MKSLLVACWENTVGHNVGTFWHHSLDPYLREVPRVSWLLCGNKPHRTYATNAITRPSSSCRNVYYSRVNYLTLHVAVTVQSQIISIGSSQSFTTHTRTEVSFESPLNASWLRSSAALTVNYQRQQSTQLLLHWNATPTALRTEVKSTPNELNSRKDWRKWTALTVRAIIIC